jgi:hypothetical protein
VGEVAVHVQRRLEALYALEPEEPVTDYLIPPSEVAHLPGGGSRTLVTQEGDVVRVGVVLDEATGARIEQADPRERLDHANLGSFSTLTEEVSHFLYVLSRARSERTLTRLELELQAEVDKYLAAVLFLSLQNEGAVSSSLRHWLFRRWRLAGGVSAERAERYRAASVMAESYCAHLESRYLKRGRLAELARETRRFYRLAQREKLETIAGIRWA